MKGSFRMFSATSTELEEQAKKILHDLNGSYTRVREYPCDCGPGPRVIVDDLMGSSYPLCCNLEELSDFIKKKNFEKG